VIFRNYNRQNYFKNLIDSFSKDTAHVGFGVTKAYASARYKWVAEFLYKHHNNIATNTHKAYVAFYNNNDIIDSEYGNVAALMVEPYSLVLGVSARTKFPIIYHEFTSKQYKNISQEYIDSDYIEFLLLSGRLESDKYDPAVLGDGVDGDREVNIFHQYGDTPIFVASGYVYNKGLAGEKYVFDNQPNEIEVMLNRARIVTNDSQEDVYNTEEFREAMIADPITNGSGNIIA
jgi:hypothetical protein